MTAKKTKATADRWRPIETAPNDESILVYRDDGSTQLVSAGDNDYTWEKPRGKRVPGITRPTHWMPLPAPPTT